MGKESDLINAASNGNVSKVKELLSDPTVNVNCGDSNSFTPFNCAAWFGHAAIIELMLEDPRVDPNKPGKIGETPLFCAVQRKFPNIIRLLIKNPRVRINQAKDDGATPFLYGAQEGFLEEIKILLADSRLDVNAPLKTGVPAIFLAAQNGHFDVVRWTLAMGKDVNLMYRWSGNNNNAAEQARAKNHTNIAELIERYMKNPGSVRIELRKQLGLPPESTSTPELESELIKAATNGNLAKCLEFIRNGTVDLNCVEPNGYTPLNCAAWFGHTEVVEALLNEPRVDINKPAKIGETPFFISVQRRFPQIIKLFLRNSRTKINEKKDDGATAFLFGAQEGYVEGVRLLLEDPRTDVNIPLNTGVTPIYLAAQNGHLEVVQWILLLSGTVDVQRRANSTNLTASEQARQKGHYAIADLLDTYSKEPEKVRKYLKKELAYDMILPLLEPQPPVPLPLSSVPLPIPKVQVKALYSYTAARKEELSFQVGEIMTIEKKDPSGWWLAFHESSKKSGLVPSTFLEDYTPPLLPVPPAHMGSTNPVLGGKLPGNGSSSAIPIPTPGLGSPQSSFASLPPAYSPRDSSEAGIVKQCLIEFNNEKDIVSVECGSIEAMADSVRSHFNIYSPFKLEYYNEEFNEYVVLRKVDQIQNRPKLRVVLQTFNWWVWPVDSSWKQKGFETTRYNSLLIKDGPNILNTAGYDKLKYACETLDIDTTLIHLAYAVSNDRLLAAFEAYRDTTYAKHRASPTLFKKDDWASMPPVNERMTYIEALNKKAQKFPWNEGKSLPVLLMLQGTSQKAVWQICQQGFGITSTLDVGYYGKGIYFTSSHRYASKFARKEDSGQVFLISCVTPGNPFPVTEHPFNSPDSYMGKPCRTGYQSHYTLVNKDISQDGYPVLGKVDVKETADELVIFEYSQALPLFVIYIN